MKNYRFSFMLIIFAVFLSGRLVAQTSDEAAILVRQGKQLNDAKKYDEAAEKLKQALNIDGNNLFGNYQLALALFSTNKGPEALSYLQKVIDGKSANLTPAAYDLQSLVYFKNKQYAEAEKSAIKTIKLSPANAGAQRTYALVTFHQNKRAAALLGFCSFVLLEPNTARSAQAYDNIKQIIQGGTLKPEAGQATIIPDANITALNQAITVAVASVAKEKHASADAVLTAQLINIFTAVGQLAEKQTGDDFFRNYMAAFFYKMTQSPCIHVMAHLISGTTEESKQWLKDNTVQVDELNKWIAATKRGFE